MTVFFEYSNPFRWHKLYRATEERLEKKITHAVIRAHGFKGYPYRYCRKKKISHISYELTATAGLRRAIAFLNREKNPIRLTVMVDHALTKREKKLFDGARRPVCVIDHSGIEENLVYYRKHKAILFEAERENTVLDADLRHLCRFGEVLYQCRFSDCLGKTLSVDRRGRLSFCPYAPEKSLIGDLRGSGDFRQAEAFCRIQKVFEEKRQRCQASCDHYEICMGVCPLEKGCLDFPKRLQDADRYLEELVQNGKSLAVCDYATLHTVISDICFGEAD